MENLVKATYEHGAFVPEAPLDLPEGAKVLLAVHGPDQGHPRQVACEEERRTVLRNLIERMKANPIPADSPRFTRDQMHERR